MVDMDIQRIRKLTDWPTTEDGPIVRVRYAKPAATGRGRIRLCDDGDDGDGGDVRRRGEGWSSENQDEERSSENLLHGANVARGRLWKCDEGHMNQVRNRLISRYGDLT